MDIHYHLGSFAFIGMKFIVLLRESVSKYFSMKSKQQQKCYENRKSIGNFYRYKSVKGFFHIFGAFNKPYVEQIV